MILQVGGSISFAPEARGPDAKWLTDDTRHMLAELDPQRRPGDDRDQHQPDEHHGADGRGRLRRHLACIPRSGLPTATWSCRPLRAGSMSTCGGCRPAASSRTSSWRRSPQLETVERLIRRGAYTGPLNRHLGGHRRRVRRAEPVQHDRVRPPGTRTGRAHARIADAQRAAGQHHGDRHGPAYPVRQRGHPVGPDSRTCDPVARSRSWCASPANLDRDVATGKEAREVYKLDEHYGSAEETVAKIGFPPGRKPGQSASRSTPDAPGA